MGATAKQNIKMSFRLRTNKFFIFLCLRTSKILSLGEFDELKSHPFLVHFSDIFLSKKNDLCAELWNNQPNCYVVGNSRKKRIFAEKGAEGG